MSNEEITEKTKVAIRVTSWWHLIILVATIVWWGLEIKISVDNATATAASALDQSKQNDSALRAIQMDLKVFHQKYEDDMDRYIREHPEQHH